MRNIGWLLIAMSWILAVSCNPQDGGQSASMVPSLNGPTASPDQVAEGFLTAMQRDDAAKVKGFLTTKARQALNDDEGFQFNGGDVESFEVGQPEINGGSASVPVQVTEKGQTQNMTLKMRQDGGQWRIHGFGVSMGGSAEFTIDLEGMDEMMNELGEAMAEELGQAMTEGFEQAMADMENGGSAEEIAAQRARYDATVSTTGSQFEDQWLWTGDVEDRPASAALTAILSGTGLELDAGAHKGLLRQKVSVPSGTLSRVQAIEAVCRQAGVYPVYPDNTVLWSHEGGPLPLQVNAGARPYPVAFAGPYLVEVSELEEEVPNATGNIRLNLYAVGLPESVHSLMVDNMFQFASLAKVASATGHPLNAEEGMSYYSSAEVHGGLTVQSLSFRLKNLLRSVEHIALIQGSLRVVLPEVVRETRWDGRKSGQWTDQGLQVEVGKSGDFDEFTVIAEGLETDNARVLYAPEDASGQPLGVTSSSNSNMQGRMTVAFQTPRPTANAGLKVVQTRAIDYTFQLKNVPLKHHAQMPARLERLSFGDYKRPLDARFGKMLETGNMPRVTVEVKNHSNKDVKSVQANFVYMDAGGNVLEEFPHTLTGAYDMDGQKPVAKKGELATVETHAFFMPDGTRRIRVDVTDVEFVDLSEWSTKQ